MEHGDGLNAPTEYGLRPFLSSKRDYSTRSFPGTSGSAIEVFLFHLSFAHDVVLKDLDAQHRMNARSFLLLS